MISFPLLLKTLANHKTDGDITAGYVNTEANTLRQANYGIAEFTSSSLHLIANKVRDLLASSWTVRCPLMFLSMPELIALNYFYND